MGYDMSIRGDDVEDTALINSLQAEFHAAAQKRNEVSERLGRDVAEGSYQEGIDADRFTWGGTFANAHPEYAAAQAEVMRLSEEIDKARVSYFRLNVWGMARYRDVMEAVEMGYWPEDHPDWPSTEAFGITQEVLDKHRGYDDEHRPLTEAEVKACEDFEQQIEYVRKAHLGETPGIPLNKFCSNDGWIVTPTECSSALELFGRFIAAGYGLDPKQHRDALATFRKADESERRIIASKALALVGSDDLVKVGHDTSAFGGENDDRATVLDVLAEDYFLDWLRYLEVASRHDGFEVW